MRWNARTVGLLALAAAAGAALFALRSGSSGETSGIGPAPVPGASETWGSTLALEVPPVEAADAPETSARELPDGVWIRGRVVVPGGTPSDERVEVAARVLSFDDSPGYVAGIDGDGKFSVMFPRDVDSGWIEVHARYLVLQPNQEVDLESPPEEIVIEPVLGARIRGRIAAPGRPESETRALAGTCVEISSNGGPGFRCFNARRTCVGEDLSFEFLALPPCAGYEIATKPRDFLRFDKVIEAPAGRTTDVEVRLRAGVRVSGRVLDPDGNPVNGAEVWRTDARPRLDPVRVAAEATSGSDGSFRMLAIPSGDVAIAVRANGYLREIVELGRLDDGDVREDLEVRLRIGIVRGRVVRADGSAAWDAVVELCSWRSLDSATVEYGEPTVTSGVDGEGRFRLGATHEGPFTLFARSPEAPAVNVEDLAEGETGGVARLDGVQPSADFITLVLEPGQDIRGRVTDDLGNPVTSFTVHGFRTLQPGMRSIANAVRGDFYDPDGAFAFVGLSRGEWAFRASVGEHRCRSSCVVELPHQGAPIVLVIPRATRVSGIVVDPDGRPVAGAAVHSRTEMTLSEDDGRFELTDLLAGRAEIWAEAASFAPSERMRLSLEPAGSAAGVRLALRRGGTIECRVLDAGGRPEPGRTVAVERLGGIHGYEDVDTPDDEADEEGRIVFEDLPSGSYLLTKCSTYRESLEEMESDPDLATRSAAGRIRVSAVVVAGETTRVVLGGPGGAPVTVRGRVSAGGSPRAGIEVGAWAMGTLEEDAAERRTDAEGRFEFLVDQPGDLALRFTIDDAGVQLTTWREVAADATGELNLTLPRGRISGVVRSHDDRPVDGASVLIEGDGAAGSPMSWVGSGWVTTGSDGRFSFDYMPGGSYDMRVLVGSLEDEEWTTTKLVLEEGGRREDVVIRSP